MPTISEPIFSLSVLFVPIPPFRFLLNEVLCQNKLLSLMKKSWFMRDAIDPFADKEEDDGESPAKFQESDQVIPLLCFFMKHSNHQPVNFCSMCTRFMNLCSIQIVLFYKLYCFIMHHHVLSKIHLLLLSVGFVLFIFGYSWVWFWNRNNNEKYIQLPK